MKKYFYRVGKKLIEYYQDGRIKTKLFSNDIMVLKIIRNTVNNNHRNIFTCKDLNGIQYYIYIDSIKEYARTDNQLLITFRDNSELIINMLSIGECNMNYYFLKRNIIGENISFNNITNEIIFVDNSFNNGNDTYDNIQNAIDNSQPGGWIYVYSGTYDGFHINQNINIYFCENSIIDVANGNAITLTGGNEANIYGKVSIVMNASGDLLRTDNNILNRLYFEFNEINLGASCFFIQNINGDIYIKGNTINSVETVNSSGTAGKFIMDTLIVDTNGDTFWNNYVKMDINIYRNMYNIARIFNANIEHPETPIIHYENCFLVSKISNNVSTLTGVPQERLELYLSDTMMLTSGTNHNILGTTQYEGTINIRCMNDCYCNNGMNQYTEYVQGNGKELIVDVNLENELLITA